MSQLAREKINKSPVRNDRNNEGSIKEEVENLGYNNDNLNKDNKENFNNKDSIDNLNRSKQNESIKEIELFASEESNIINKNTINSNNNNFSNNFYSSNSNRKDPRNMTREELDEYLKRPKNKFISPIKNNIESNYIIDQNINRKENDLYKSMNMINPNSNYRIDNVNIN